MGHIGTDRLCKHGIPARSLGGDKNEKSADAEKKSVGSESDAPKKRGRKKKNKAAQDTSQPKAVSL